MKPRACLRHLRIDPNDDSISCSNDGKLVGGDPVDPAALYHDQLCFLPGQQAVRNANISAVVHADWRSRARRYV